MKRMLTNQPTTAIEPITICVTEFGAQPDSGLDAAYAVRLAIQAASRVSGPAILQFPKGQYDLYPDQALRIPYSISNTASEEEVSGIMKTIGLYFDRHRHLTIEGNGSLLMYHGKQTMLAFEACESVKIQNLRIDVADPTMAEMTVASVGEDYVEVDVHPDSRYEIDHGRLYWVGSGWRFHEGPMQEYDPVSNMTWRTENWCELAVKVEEVAHNRLRMYYSHPPTLPVGRTLQVRDGIRDQVGVFIHRSRNIEWTNVRVHYMHGLGVVSQFSEHLAFDNMEFAPRPESQRTAAAFADLMHFSGCRGLIKITNSKLSGAHDDAINIHGTHLRIVDVPAPDQIVVRFMHPQTSGLDGFYPGDQIHFVREHSLAVFGSNKVKRVKRMNARELCLVLEERVPEHVEADDVIENVTWNPDVEIRNNHIVRMPTRGILITSPGRILIEDNVFERTGMSGILIANDASSWFESGKVKDVVIRGNRFIACGNREHPVIYILPENKHVQADQPVHEHIRIEDNRIELTDALVLYAKSTNDIAFLGNQVVNAQTTFDKKMHALAGGMEMKDDRIADEACMYFEGCGNVVIANNTLQGEALNKLVCTRHMSQQDLSLDASQALSVRMEEPGSVKE